MQFKPELCNMNRIFCTALFLYYCIVLLEYLHSNNADNSVKTLKSYLADFLSGTNQTHLMATEETVT